MKFNYFFMMLIAASLIIACGDDEPMEPTCDTADLTYTDDISTILNASCALSGCHAEGSTTTFEMNNYVNTEIAVGFGRIVGAITHTDGFVAMPFPEPSMKIDSCNILKLTQWIADGAPE